MDTAELQRRAGITEWDHPNVKPSSAYQAAVNFINGNNDEAFRATGGDIAEFAKILLILKKMDHDEMQRFIEVAAQDKYQAFTR